MENIINRIYKEHLIMRLICLILGTFLAAFIYNKFFVENNIVIGGVSGLAILIKEIFNIDTTLFINMSNIILIILSFLILGKRKTFILLIGCVTYLIMLNITAPLVEILDFTFDENMLMIIITSLVWGLANGLIYRAGYSTGGMDFLTQIISLKTKKSITQTGFIIDIIIIILSAFVFDISNVLISLFIIYCSNKISNAVLFGVSTSKMVYIISKDNKKIEQCITEKFKTGSTEIKVHGGLFERKNQMLLCIIHNAQYSKFKEAVLTIDPNAFLISNKCYEVKGGVKFNVLPF